MKKKIEVEVEEFEFVFSIETPYDKKDLKEELESHLASRVGESGFNLRECSLRPTEIKRLKPKRT